VVPSGGISRALTFFPSRDALHLSFYLPAMFSFKLTATKLTSRGADASVAVDVPAGATLLDVRKLCGAATGVAWPSVELRSSAASVKDGAVVFSGDLKPAAACLGGARAVFVKDLGPQFSYRGVFLVEYGGPLAIMLAYCARPAAVYGAAATPLRFWEALTAGAASAPEGSKQWAAFVQALAISMWLAHFAKREVET